MDTGPTEDLVAAIPDYAFTLIRIGVIVTVALLLHWTSRILIRRFLKRTGGEHYDISRAIEQKRAQTLGSVLKAVSTTIIWMMTALLALQQVDVNIAPLLAAAGIGGVALGFGAQHLVRDIIAGFFILLEDQYHVGDVIQIAGVAGIVEKITLRTTALRDLDGKRHVVPNGEVGVTTNFTKDFSRYLINLPVPYEENVDRVMELVRTVAEDMRAEPDYAGVMLGPLEILGVDDYGDSEVVVKMYVETMPGKQWKVGREFRRRIKHAYDAAGISIPYPHRQVIVRDETPPEAGSPDGKRTRSGTEEETP